MRLGDGLSRIMHWHQTRSADDRRKVDWPISTREPVTWLIVEYSRLNGTRYSVSGVEYRNFFANPVLDFCCGNCRNDADVHAAITDGATPTLISLA